MNTIKTKILALCLLILILFSFSTEKSFSQTILFSEDFQNGIPGTFTLIDNDGLTPDANVAFVTNAWVSMEVSPGDSAALSTSWYSPAGQSDDWLISPAISLGSVSFLTWNAKAADPSFPDGYEVRISTTGKTIANFLANPVLLTVPAEATTFTAHNVSLSAYPNKTVYIAFRNNSTDKYLLYIDDISVSMPAGDDLEISSLLSPVTNGCQLSSTETIKATIKNNGTSNISNVNISYTINGGAEVTEFITSIIPSGGSLNYSFLTKVNLSGNNTYSISVYHSLLTDGNNSNDTLITDVFSATTFDLISPFSVSFETGEPIGTWKIGEDVNADNQTWNIKNDIATAKTGVMTVSIPTHTITTNNDWFFSPCLKMTAGSRYKISFWYMTQNVTPHNILLKLGTSPKSASMTFSVADHPNLFSTTYMEISDTITSPGTGTYYLGIKDYSDPNVTFPRIYIDDININNLPTTSFVADFSSNKTVSCKGGSISFTDLSTAGVTSWAWIFAGGTPSTSTTQNPTVIYNTPGTYNVILTSTNGTTTDSIVKLNYISVSTPIVITLTGIDPTCFGSSNGAINSSVNGGTSPYSYSWSNGLFSSNNLNLAMGNYTVTLTDSKGCSATASNSLSQPTDIVLNTVTTDATCGQSNGTATVSVTGGIAPYTYSWSTAPVQTTLIISGLSDGVYTVTVTDSKLCQKTSSVTISTSSTPIVNLSPNNISCFGKSDGSITLSVSSGTSPFNFMWSNGQTTSTINNIKSGLYTVTVTDANNCTVTSSTSITEPAPMNLSFVNINASCGSTNGSIILTVTSGNSPYTYTWSNGAISSQVDNLSAGSYTVTVTDTKGCTNTGVSSVSNIGAPIVTLSEINLTCFNSNNGSITSNISGGTAPYTYLWSNNQTSQNLNNIPSGNYSVTVTDSKGCQGVKAATIAQPDELIVVITTTDATCGATNGNANANISGGTSPYNYSWSNGAVTSQIDNLSSGSYSVTITDSKGCSNTQSSSVANIGAPLISLSVTDVSCFGSSNGSITSNISGGTSPYTFSWSNNQTTQDLNNIQAGSYSLTITDSKGCAGNKQTNVLQPTEILITLSSTNTSCGSSNGTASANISGGASPYTYLWSTGSTNSQLNSLAAGSYILTVTDANGCTNSSTTSISNIGAQSLSFSVTDVSCFNGSNGSIISTITGGTTPYTFSWSTNQTTQNLNNLGAGSYTMTVTDSKGCVSIKQATVTQPNEITIVVSTTDATCGSSNGTATSFVSGGIGTYTYLWSNGATTSFVNTFSSGNYTLSVTDSKGCTQTSNALINNSGGPVVISSTTNVKCKGGSDGLINLSVTGGTSPYTYLWSGGQNSQNISSIPAGLYSVTVTDSKSCIVIKSITLAETTGLSIQSTVVDATCRFSNGSATLIISGGTSPYSYLWDNGSVTSVISNLSSGNYATTVTDANNCTSMTTVAINNTGVPSITYQTQKPTCANSSDGSITVSVIGSITPTFKWSNGMTTQSLTNLLAGSYGLTITDTSGCIRQMNIIVETPVSILLTSQITKASCGLSDGAINLTVQNGTTPYTYLWSNGSITQDITGLNAGQYLVTVTDAKGCKETLSSTLNNSSAPVLSFITTSISCTGAQTGKIDMTISGGVSPYTIKWSTGEITEDIVNMKAGIYTVTVTDFSGCKVIKNIEVKELNVLNVVTLVTGSDCNQSNGTITTNVAGGVSPFQYSWSNNSTNSIISNLSPGNYFVTVTDSKACKFTSGAIINDKGSANPSINVQSVTCYGGSDGKLSTTVTGNNPPFTYLWNTQETTSALSNLKAGPFTLTVTDNIGCKSIRTAMVTQPDSLNILYSVILPTPNTSNGVIIVSPKGGVPPYTYFWSNGDLDNTNSAIPQGKYTVIVTDANNCVKNKEIVLGTPNGFDEPLKDMNIKIYPNPSNGEFTIEFLTTTENNHPIQIRVYNIISKTLISEEMTNISKNNFLRKLNLKDSPSGVYMVQIQRNNKSYFKLLYLIK